MKRYWKSIRYIDLCLLWRFEVPVIGVRMLSVDTLLYIRVTIKGELMKGTHAGYCLKKDLIPTRDTVLGHFESKILY